MSFKERALDTFHLWDLSRRCTGTDIVFESTCFDLSGTGDSGESFAIEPPIFIARQLRQADLPESLEFLISRESPDSRESCESIH